MGNNQDMLSRPLHRTTPRSPGRYGAIITAVAVALSGVGATPAGAVARSAVPPATIELPGATPLLPTVVIRYSFEPRSGGIIDESGRGHRLRRLTSSGGTTRIIARATGRAVAFPAKCRGKRCPRAVLQVPHAADLNPGAAPFGFGATVRLARQQTSAGQNVMQKGYTAAGSQYKLQIDGIAGKPSCVLVGRRKPVVRLARSSRTVADGAWHSIACRRTRNQLAILIDGAVRGHTWVPAGLSILNSRPLSIGGKGAHQDNDQFQGAIDDIWVSVS